MITPYVTEYAEITLLTLELVEREAKHLQYTYQKIVGKGLVLDWVNKLADQPDEAELVDAFVARFARLQDTLADKLIPRFAALLGENPKSFIDTLSFAERQGWIDNGDDFIAARRLRNRLVHEYMIDPEQFLDALIQSSIATLELLGIVKRIRKRLDDLGIKEGAEF